MGFFDLLAKLGILRYGSKSATYTSGRDRPSEFQMDGVLDAKRNLVASGDTSATSKKTPSGGSNPGA